MHGFFHVNQGVLCSEHAEQASSRGVLEGGWGWGVGGGGNRLAKRHAEQASSRGVLEGGGGGGGQQAC